MQALERAGLAVRLPAYNVLIFSVAMTGLLLVDRQDYSPGHASLLRFLFGDDSTTLSTISARLVQGVPLEHLAEQAAAGARAAAAIVRE